MRLDATRGYFVYTVSDKHGPVDDDHLLNGKTWLDYVHESIYVPIDSWKEIKAYIIKSCKKFKNCDDSITSWDKKILTIDSNIQK